MSEQPCNCRPCRLRRSVEEADQDDLLPQADELADLPDDLGADYGETDQDNIFND
jgi:hypothetical protein